MTSQPPTDPPPDAAVRVTFPLPPELVIPGCEPGRGVGVSGTGTLATPLPPLLPEGSDVGDGGIGPMEAGPLAATAEPVVRNA